MENLTNEQKAKLSAAKSGENAAQLLQEAGVDAPQADKELNLDELEAISGGADRDWLTDGCAATVLGSTVDHYKCNKCGREKDVL